MSYDYDKLYAQTPDALGAPTKEIVGFFRALGPDKLRILDVGCGQGRDALFLGRIGHAVCGVDLSPNGIRDVTAAAGREGLDVRGVVADLCDYVPEGSFDVVLIDRTLHMLDEADRLAVLARLLGHVRPHGWCLIVDEKRNLAGFKPVADADPAGWAVEKERGGYLFLRRAGAAS